MANSIRVDLPNIPEGDEVEVLYLGAFKNGTVTEVSDEAATLWSIQTGRDWPAGATMVVTHDDTNAQNAAAIEELRSTGADGAERAKEIEDDIKRRNELLVSDSPPPSSDEEALVTVAESGSTDSSQADHATPGPNEDVTDEDTDKGGVS